MQKRRLRAQNGARRAPGAGWKFSTSFRKTKAPPAEQPPFATGSPRMESARDTPRPFTSPAAVTFAAFALIAVAAASFTSSLTRQLRLPRPVDTAKVVVMPPQEAPQPGPSGALAYMAPVTPPPATPPKPRRPARAVPDEVPPAAPIETVTVARAAPLDAADATAIVPIVPPRAPEAELAAP